MGIHGLSVGLCRWSFFFCQFKFPFTCIEARAAATDVADMVAFVVHACLRNVLIAGLSIVSLSNCCLLRTHQI